MRDKKILTLPVIILIIVIPFVIGPIWSALTGHSAADVQEKIEDYLYEKYGEEFVVDRIGTRSSRGEEFYQARIYPKSIIGTNREGDDYYYASASVDKLSLGRLGGVGDSYSYIIRNMDVENYLLPETIKIFGKRVLLKVDVAHKVTGDGSWWAGYKSKSLEEMRKDLEKEPERTRIELDFDIYIFDRIDNEEEKEERRKQIFEYIQYLKDEELFEYLEMGISFIDERVLAPGYRDYTRDIYRSKKVREKINGEYISMPPRSLRAEMSRELKKEIKEISEEELLNNMKKIRKSQLHYEKISNYNRQYLSWVSSLKMLKETSSSLYEEAEDNDNLDFYYYDDINNIIFGKDLRYIFQ